MRSDFFVNTTTVVCSCTISNNKQAECNKRYKQYTIDNTEEALDAFRFFFKTTHDQPRRFKTTLLSERSHFGIEDEMFIGFFKLSIIITSNS